MNELYHHGVMGQKWGVRNGPPYPLDTPRNRAVRNIKRAAKTKGLVDDIVNSMSYDDKRKLGVGAEDRGYLTIEQGEYVIKRVIKKYGDIPVSFFDALDEEEAIYLAMGTRSGEQYRGKGYGTRAAKQCMNYLDSHPEIVNGRDIIWGVREDNAASIAIAKKLGFEYQEAYGNGWLSYVKHPDSTKK